MTATLMIEIGVEELPPQAMRSLADAFAQGISATLAQAGLEHGDVVRYATPRRLAVAIADVPGQTRPAQVKKTGPTTAIAFDESGAPTPAAQGFARSLGVTVAELAREDSDKGERLVHKATEPGRPLADILQADIDNILNTLPIPKRMRWGESTAEFVRPVHWLLALHGDAPLALEVFGIAADRRTYGHRFHHPEAIELVTADDYAQQLRQPGHVIADPDKRRQLIIDQTDAAAAGIHGRAVVDRELVEEVTALVEWPVAVTGTFDRRFLDLPREVLVSTLQGHQRYFPVEDEAGTLLPSFITIANIESRDVAQVIAGNERVIRPRLSDALFFWDQDRRQGLVSRVDGLARVSFQKQLGSLADKSERVRKLVGDIVPYTQADTETVDRAAILAKTDLLTQMVDEFPDLQGVMGRYYALDAGEPQTVADALAEQYQPAYAGAAIASSRAGQTLALADRLDTLAGIFAINRRPSGDRDPFALRRAALGVLRTLIEAGIRLDLAALLRSAVTLQPVAPPEDTNESLWMFHMERLRGYYADLGFDGAVFDAVAALGIVDMVDFDRRLRATADFMRLPTATVVCGAHKRIRNILKRNAASGNEPFDPAALIESEEKMLAEALESKQGMIEAGLAAGEYDTALSRLAELAEPLDLFFDQVMVMCEDTTLRQNRLALLGQLDTLCRRVADISCLSPQ